MRADAALDAQSPVDNRSYSWTKYRIPFGKAGMTVRSVLLKILGVFVILSAIAGFITLLEYPSYHDSKVATAKLVALADHVQPGNGWKQDSDERILGTFMCMGVDVPCASLQRSWTPDHTPTTAEFNEVVKHTGWDMKVDPSCDPPKGASGLIIFCSATAVVDSHYVRLDLIRTGADNDREVIVNLSIIRQSQ